MQKIVFIFACCSLQIQKSCSRNYVVRTGHGQYTRNDKMAVKVPRMRTEFGRKSFSVPAANVFNKLPILTRQLDSRVLFRSNLDNLYTCI